MFNQIISLVQKCSCCTRHIETLCLVLYDIALYNVKWLLYYWRHFISYTNFSSELVTPPQKKKLYNLITFGLFAVCTYLCVLLKSNNSYPARWKPRFVVLSAARPQWACQRTGVYHFTSEPLLKVANWAIIKNSSIVLSTNLLRLEIYFLLYT